MEVGDIVYVQRGQEFPADLVLLASALEEGICYVETSNLDGETNLKQRKAHPVSVPWDAPEKLLAVQARVRAEAPHEQLYEFKARFEFDRPMTGVDGPKQIPLSENQLLLRVCFPCCLVSVLWCSLLVFFFLIFVGIYPFLANL